MKNYRITKIMYNGDTWVENGNGMYERAGDPDTKKHIMDFFSPLFGNPYISEVQRKTDNTIFAIGMRLNDGQVTATTIQNIYFENKIIKLGTNKAPRINLDDARLYVAPPVMQPAAPVVNKGIEIFDKVEALIVKEKQLRIKILKKYLPESPEEFLKKFFTEWNLPKSDTNTKGGKETIYVDDESIQTTNNRRRSIGDLFLLCKYYYPKITLKEVVKIMYVTLPSKYDWIRTSYCNTIYKRVWYNGGSGRQDVCDITKADEYGYLYKDYLNLVK